MKYDDVNLNITKIISSYFSQAKRCFNGLLEVLGNFSTWELDWIEKLKGSTLWHGINSKMLADLPEYWLENYELKYFESQNCSSVKQVPPLKTR